LHPLEVLALNSLPWKARIARIAYYCHAGKFGRRVTGHLSGKYGKKWIKKVIEVIGEPWGKKGKFAEALAEEFERQREIRLKREKAKRSIYSCRLSDYDPNIPMYYKWSVEDRVKTIVRRRIGTAYRSGLDMSVRWRRHLLPARNFRDAKLTGGAYFAVFHPGAVKVLDNRTIDGFTWHTSHKIAYLFYKVGSAAGAVRVSHKARTVESAIASLERAEVSRARKKGYSIRINWEKLCFEVRSPRRRKWREVPFKESKRARRR
jgi:hypothetical protein